MLIDCVFVIIATILFIRPHLFDTHNSWNLSEKDYNNEATKSRMASIFIFIFLSVVVVCQLLNYKS